MKLPTFDELMATNPPRIEVMFRRGPGGEEQFQWGITERGIPILTAIGLIVRVQGELPLLEPGDERHSCGTRQSLVIAVDRTNTTKSMRWFLGPDIPLDPLLGILETIKDMLVSSQLAQRATANHSTIVGPDGSPMRR